MRILGIDPGSRITGYGIIEQNGNKPYYIASGCIKLKSRELSSRLGQIYTSIVSILEEFSPTEVAIEKVFMCHNVSSALKLGHARGAAMVAVARNNLLVTEYSARQIKKSIAGYGGADKKQMQHMTQMLLSLSGLPQTDAADALAVAICHAHTARCNKFIST